MWQTRIRRSDTVHIIFLVTDALKQQIRTIQDHIWDQQKILRNLERDLRLQLHDVPVDFFQLNAIITVPLELNSYRLSDDKEESPVDSYNLIISDVIRNIEEGYNDPECSSKGRIAVELLEQKIIKMTHDDFNELWGGNHFNATFNKMDASDLLK